MAGERSSQRYSRKVPSGTGKPGRRAKASPAGLTTSYRLLRFVVVAAGAIALVFLLAAIAQLGGFEIRELTFVGFDLR